MEPEASTVSIDLNETEKDAGITQLVSYAVYKAVYLYIGNVAASVAVFGFLSNVVNMIVFYKIGFTRPTNICYFVLSITDLVNVTWVFLLALANNPLFDEGQTIIPLLYIVLMGSTISYCCMAMGSWTTAIISLERCCCVIFPMKVKLIFSRRVVHMLMLFMFLYQIATATPFFFSFDMITVTDPATNWTMIMMDLKNQDTNLALLVKFLSFSAPTFICFVLVVIGTTFLIKIFNSSSKKREEMTGKKSEEASAKDKRVVKSVTLICLIYIIGFAPNVGIYATSIIYPTLHLQDPYLGNLLRVLGIIAYLIQTISCSINIFIYYRMNSTYRTVCDSILPCCSGKDNNAGKR